jgi:peptidoglycan hydrolase CwlO-like protein
MVTTVNSDEELNSIQSEIKSIAALISKLIEVTDLNSKSQDTLQKQIQIIGSTISILHDRIQKLESQVNINNLTDGYWDEKES